MNILKSAESFNLPGLYKKSLIGFVKGIEKSIREEVLLLALTGSGGREDIIEGWSDLDILIVLNKINREKIIIISDFVNASPIKIGTTVYSREEFEKGLVDSKTIINLEFIRENVFCPIILNESLTIPYFSKEQRIKIDKGILPEFIHEFKRALYDVRNMDVHSVGKTVNTIMKIILRLNGEVVCGYEAVHREFYKKFQDCPKVFCVHDLIKGDVSEVYHKQCCDFIEYITSKDF